VGSKLNSQNGNHVMALFIKLYGRSEWKSLDKKLGLLEPCHPLYPTLINGYAWSVRTKGLAKWLD
jgi:hypothetical protein